MPLSFVQLPKDSLGIVLNPEEKNFLNFVESLEPEHDSSSHDYAVTVNIELKFTKSKTRDALDVRITNDQEAPEVRLSEEQIRENYPWDYKELTNRCKSRYSDFKQVKKYHDLRKSLEKNDKYAIVRLLDPSNPKGSKKKFYNPNILQKFDETYTKLP